MPRQILVFAIATVTPVLLLMIAAGFGGLWAWLALGYMTVFVFAMDELISYVAPAVEPETEFPAADELSITLGASHFILLLVAVYAIAGHTDLGWLPRVVLFFAFGLFFGQVSNSNAHELIHRSEKGLFSLGMWIFISLLFGQHTSAHRLVHHRHVATLEDPNSAPAGESFWQFLPRAWGGAFVAGYQAERELRARAASEGVNPYAIYILGALGFLLLFYLLMGWGGLAVYLLLAGYAQLQLMLSDYVQHYGLERQIGPDGRPEPFGDGHSWNSGRWYSSALMLNAPRHSAHHAHPAWHYPELTLPQPTEAPRLPFSLPVMATLALIPPLWFRVITPRLGRWLEAAG
ncbi:alkane 1-monooxygenase [Solirhodobacter olei]|uniref:alkane 1-monooxygenase n=1 Tax=Solirhodobacter olei TaxID=2493082 RepID=UPI000FD887F2|nr:alkane 1-monooxygenase [Solirhodobacter olei]